MRIPEPDHSGKSSTSGRRADRNGRAPGGSAGPHLDEHGEEALKCLPTVPISDLEDRL